MKRAIVCTVLVVGIMGKARNCLYSFGRGWFMELSVQLWKRALWGKSGIVCTVFVEGIMGE